MLFTATFDYNGEWAL